MSLKQTVLDMTPEARDELRALLDSLEPKAEVAVKDEPVAAKASKTKKEATEASSD